MNNMPQRIVCPRILARIPSTCTTVNPITCIYISIIYTLLQAPQNTRPTTLLQQITHDITTPTNYTYPIIRIHEITHKYGNSLKTPKSIPPKITKHWAWSENFANTTHTRARGRESRERREKIKR